MEVREVLVRKYKLEADLKEMLQAFMRETGTNLTHVNLGFINVTRMEDTHERHEFAVNVKLELV